MADFNFYGWFMATKVGKTGLTVTVDVRNKAGTLVVTGGSATEIGGGLYIYTHSTATLDDYTAVFKTTDATVDAQHVPSLISVQQIRLDTPLSTRASGSALTSGSVIADLVWDEVLTGATHNVVSSAGRRLRQIASSIIIDGMAVTGTENTITLAADASSVNGAYDPSLIYIVNGAGAGQCRLIYQYTGSTKIAVVDRNWKVIPDTTSEYIIAGDPGRENVNEGLARGGSASAIQLNESASPYDNAYVGQVIFIRSGTGEDQARRVYAYDGTSKIASMAINWDVTPDTTSAYAMLPTGLVDVARFIDMIWNEQLAGHTIAGTSGCALALSNPSSSVTVTVDPKDIWEYTRRTLTYSPDNSSSISNGDVEVVRGDTLVHYFIDLDLTGYESSYFTVKRNYKDTDAQAILQVSSASGLLYLNGVDVSGSTSGSYSGSSVASITSGSSSSILTLTLDSIITKELPYSSFNYVYDLQLISASGIVTTPEIGDLTVIRDVTKKVS